MWKLATNLKTIAIAFAGRQVISNSNITPGTIESVDNGIVAVDVAPGAIDIIAVPGYTRSDSALSIDKGEFWYDYSTNRLLINPIRNTPRFYYYPLYGNQILKTNCANLPIQTLLQSLNAIGTVTLTKSFEGLPNCTINLKKCPPHFNWCNFINGSRYQLFGMQWLQDNIKVTTSIDRTSIQLDLIGKHFDRALDKPIYLKRLACQKGSGLLTIAELAAHIGINYSGENIDIKVDRSMGVESATTFRSELEKRAITLGCFVYYSGDSVTIKKWAHSYLHFISPTEIRSQSITYERSGDYAQIEDCLKLTEELRNAEVQLDLAEPTNQLQLLVSLEGAESAFDVGLPPQLPSTTGIYESDLPFETIYNPGICFDTGGKTKKIVESWQVRGTETIRTESIYGFVFTSLDVYEPLATSQKTIPTRKLFPPSQSSFWQKIQETTTLHTFDRDGYLILTTTTGWKKARIKKESDALEAINLQCQILDANDVAIEEKLGREKSLYLFDEIIPINETQFYQLGKLRDYYSDIRKPIDSCDPESLFVVRSLSQQFATIEKLGEDGFPISAGEWTGQERRTHITWKYRPEKFSTANYSFTSSGTNFKDSAAIATRTENSGRPSVHQRLDVSRIDYFGNSAEEWEQHLGHRYYLVTVGNEEITGTETTLSYPGVDNLEDAKKATETKISIANSRNIEKVTIDLIQYDPNINEGDRISLFGKIYIVFNIDAEFKIKGVNQLECSRFQLSLGRLVKPTVSLIVK
jgi:hypothetical protein